MTPGATLVEGALLAYDREHLWHPYTSMTAPAPVRLVDGAEGSRLHVDGRWVVDGMASWWCAVAWVKPMKNRNPPKNKTG